MFLRVLLFQRLPKFYVLSTFVRIAYAIFENEEILAYCYCAVTCSDVELTVLSAALPLDPRGRWVLCY